MSSRVRSLMTLGGFAFLLVAGLFVGMQLGERASEPGTETLTLDRPSAASPRDVALRSGGGFTGFEEGALSGLVTRSGVTSAAADGAFSVQTDTATMEVRTASPVRLYRIEVLDAPLSAGDVVVVRTDGDGSAEAVLRVPADLREGDSR